ncbi:MAG: Zn-ribbon domain-containing OB-fold protein, partial [Planctomycetota bacterium]|nr:Zn-ribbon domain-containing OB-fold protein [Planctomycetota bacterium]
GYAISRFLDGLKDGKILGVKCNKCKRVVTPPRIFCEKCFKEMDEWVELKDTGTVNTFSICYITWDMKRTKEMGVLPEIPAVIEIDGTNPRVGFLHKIGEIPPKEEGSLEVNPKSVWVGMRVKAVWKPKEEREGRITDILYFKPINE